MPIDNLERAKQEVLPAGPMDGFTPIQKINWRSDALKASAASYSVCVARTYFPFPHLSSRTGLTLLYTTSI
jgi:hypothetical protein